MRGEGLYLDPCILIFAGYQSYVADRLAQLHAPNMPSIATGNSQALQYEGTGGGWRISREPARTRQRHEEKGKFQTYPTFIAN